MFLLLPQPHVRAETDALAGKVNAFATSIGAALDTSAKSDGNGKTGQVTDASGVDKMDHSNRAVDPALIQLRLLEAAIRRNDFDTAQRMAGTLGSYDTALPQMQGKWNDFLTELTAGIEERISKSGELWYAEIRELAKDAHDACIAAKNSADLDAIMMRTAAAQMKRVRGNNVLMQRGVTMLNGIVISLQNWARYLDQRDAGNLNAANEILRNFSRNSADFPVLSADEIRSKLLPDQVEPTFKSQVTDILAGLKTLDDLPTVIARWKVFQAAPQAARTDMSQVEAMTTKLDLLLRASAELKAGNGENALAMANDPSLLSGQTDMIFYLKPLTNQLVDGVLAAKISALIGAQPAFADNPGKAINDALAALKQKGDYQGLLDLLKLQQGRAPSANTAIAPIEHFLAARRFEASGDLMMAVSEYRSVVAASDGPLLPQAEAAEALERLQKTNPEPFKDYNGVLLQELRTLREQLNQLRESRFYNGRRY